MIKLNTQKGVGLIEVLVTLFILSIGLLGIAALQATGIQAGQGASLRTSALLVVEDITSRMQANRQGVLNTTTGILSYGVAPGNPGSDNSCSDTDSDAAVACTPVQMAQHDIFLWNNSITGTLPEATGGIVTTLLAPAADGLVSAVVTVTWKEKGATKTYISEFRVRGR